MDNVIELIFKEHLSTYILIVLPLFCFIYYKVRYKDVSDYVKTFFVLGIIFVCLGCFLASIVLKPQSVIGLLSLKEIHIVGRFIPIGYAFIVLSVLFFIDTTIKKIFERFERKKIS